MRLSVLITAITVLSFRCAYGSDCPESITRSYLEPNCYCGKALLNLTASFPHPFKVVAACDLRLAQDDEVAQIDLRKQKLRLDTFVPGILYGDFFVKGRTTVSGDLLYNPGEGGDAWFTASPPLVSSSFPALAFFFNRLKVDNLVSTLPSSLRTLDCFTANAVVEIDGVRLLFGDSHEAGAYPIKIRLINLGKPQMCSHQ